MAKFDKSRPDQEACHNICHGGLLSAFGQSLKAHYRFCSFINSYFQTPLVQS